ncbi:MAG TPA: SpoIIE family protein phosphatase [Chloroflexota bacterium]|nr:SpoIIE family protein phosphatase [Chloroflexota bacterium]
MVQWHGGACRVAVIDGLGHGPAAAAAAQRATDTLIAYPALSPGEAVQACHHALHGTRGAVVSIAGIDPGAGQLTYAGVGNVEAQLWQHGRTQRLIAYRGIVGQSLPPVRPYVVSLEREWLLLLHTDGVSARFAVETLPEFTGPTPGSLATAVLAGWGRDTDDATVVVARSLP